MAAAMTTPDLPEPAAWMAEDKYRAITRRELMNVPEEKGRREFCKSLYPEPLFTLDQLLAERLRAERAEAERDRLLGIVISRENLKMNLGIDADMAAVDVAKKFMLQRNEATTRAETAEALAETNQFWAEKEHAEGVRLSARLKEVEAERDAATSDEVFESKYRDAYNTSRNKPGYWYSLSLILSHRLREMDKRSKAANRRADAAEARVRELEAAFASPPEQQDDWGMLGVAISLAAEAHMGQTDKAGRPYLEHAIRVMHRCPFDPVIKTVGVLHDVIEDCDNWSVDRMRERGFSETVCEALEAITHRKGEPYLDYVKRVGENPIAREVKLADLAYNSDPERLAELPPETAERLITKYAAASAIQEGEQK
jgi:hypothetical protein